MGAKNKDKDSLGRVVKINQSVGAAGKEKKLPEQLRDDGTMQPPSILTKRSKQVWLAATIHLRKLDTLAKVDYVALEVYCTTLDIYWKLAKDVKTRGTMIEVSLRGDINIKPHPGLSIMKNCIDTINALGTKLYLNPVSRNRLAASLESVNKEDCDPAEELLN